MTLPPDPTDEPLTDARLLALPAHRHAVCEELAVALERGAGALVFSDLRIGGGDSDLAREVGRAVALDECRGPPSSCSPATRSICGMASTCTPHSGVAAFGVVACFIRCRRRPPLGGVARVATPRSGKPRR
jgi:hypothetical protein